MNGDEAARWRGEEGRGVTVCSCLHLPMLCSLCQALAEAQQALKMFQKAVASGGDRFGFAEEYLKKTEDLLNDTSQWRADGAAAGTAAKVLGYYNPGAVEEEEEEMDFDLFD